MPLKPEHDAAETMSADGDSTIVAWGGGQGSCVVEGSFGGGSASLQASINEGIDWFLYPGSAKGADQVFGIDIGECLLKVTLTGSIGPTIRTRIGRVLQTSG